MSKIEFVKDFENVWKNIESIWKKKNFVIFKLFINALGKYIFTKDEKFSHIDSIGTQQQRCRKHLY